MKAFRKATAMRIPPRYVFWKFSYSECGVMVIVMVMMKGEVRRTWKFIPRRTYSRIPAMMRRMLNIVRRQSIYYFLS